MGYMDLMSKVENIELIGGMIKHFAAHRGTLDNVFDLEDGFDKTIWMNNCIEKLKKDPDSAKMLEERYMGPEYNLDELMKLPKNSLGYTYAKLMKTMGFEPHFYRSRDRPSLDDLSDYVTMRVRKTHDLYHTISGFNMYIGEIGVIALNVTQYAYPAFMLIDLIAVAAACFPGLAKIPESEKIQSSLVFDTLSKGLKMGREAKSLFPVKFEEMIEMPIEDVRKELKITPIKEGPSWYQYPKLKDEGLS
ncbi:MAG TPA: Coq4 family protein [Candidatus Nitrosopolaris rasttigaisensis]|jgi:ubiquinone biosynthesis protein COQ4|nr:Coq4 family protein [Candidatus Nitrosopolaris rasttigaisensis]